MNRFSFKLLAAMASALTLAACNDPSPQADSRPPATTPVPQVSAVQSAKGGPQTKLSADMELSDKVKQAVQEPGRNRVEVAADDGVVTLYGTVQQRSDRDLIALAAMDVEGVRSVINNLVAMSDS